MGPDDVTLLICTRNRVAQLQRLLSTVAVLDPPPASVFLVDNGSTDATPQLLSELVMKDTRFGWCREPVRGLGRARQRGLEGVATALVACTDDDCLLPPTHIAAVAASFDRDDLAFVGGRIVAPVGTLIRVALLEAEQGRVFAPFREVWPGEVQGANLAFRAAHLRDVGGFRVRWGAGTPFRAEDIDAAARLLSAGFRGTYRPEILVVHDHGRDEHAARRLERANARARGAFVASRVRSGEYVYAARWGAEVWQRFGWRPRHIALGVEVAAAEVFGAVQWLLAGRP